MRQWWPELHAPGALPYKNLILASNVRVGTYNQYGDLYAFVNMDGLDGLQVVYKSTGKLRTNMALSTADSIRLLLFSPDSRLLLAAGNAGRVVGTCVHGLTLHVASFTTLTAVRMCVCHSV